MKKIFKGLAVLAASTAMCAGIATATACSGYNGVYEGDYHYTNAYGATYGVKVKVTVENNIITKIEDVTNGAYTEVSPGWETYFAANKAWLVPNGKLNDGNDWKEGDALPEPWNTKVYSYSWTDEDSKKWTTYEPWLLQQYEGMSVADVLDIKVYTAYGYDSEGKVDASVSGEPYAVKDDKNVNLNASGLLISGSTQGSGRLLLAVQNALSK